MLSEGQQSYTPTRVEWLAYVLNSKNQISSPRLNGILLLYIAIPEDNILRIAVSHPPNAEQDTVNEVVESAKHAATLEAKQFGWDSWLKIEDFVQEQEKDSIYPTLKAHIEFRS